MSKSQLILFGLAMVIIVGNGGGMASLLPVYLGHAGANDAYISFLFAMLYLALSVGGILAGWLSDRIQRRKLMCVASAALEILTSILLLSAPSLEILSVILIVCWFLAGFHVALVNILVGLQAEENKRGQVFGILAFVIGLGPILSGFIYGRVLDTYGMGALWVISLVVSVLWTLIALFYKDAPNPAESVPAKVQAVRSPLGAAFTLLILASILACTVINGGKLGISIVMDRLKFSAGDISTTGGIASLVALGMPLLLGWLSDRIGRKFLIIALNLLGFLGLFILSQTQALPGFWAAASLFSLYGCFIGLANALTTDLVPRQALGVGLAWMSSASNIAGIFSSALLGVGLSGLGAATTFLVGLALPAAAIVMMVRVTERRLPAVFQLQ